MLLDRRRLRVRGPGLGAEGFQGAWGQTEVWLLPWLPPLEAGSSSPSCSLVRVSGPTQNPSRAF